MCRARSRSRQRWAKGRRDARTPLYAKCRNDALDGAALESNYVSCRAKSRHSWKVMFPLATLPRLVASSLALLLLGVGPAAAQQQQAAVVIVAYEGVARPSLCDRKSFVFLSTVQGPLLRPHTVDVTRSDPIDLVLVRRHLDSGQREEVRVPGLQPESTSDLELHCHQRINVIEESSISAHSRGVALDWPVSANQATLLTHFVDTPTARPATLLTELPPGSRSQLYLAGASRPLQDTDL